MILQLFQHDGGTVSSGPVVSILPFLDLAGFVCEREFFGLVHCLGLHELRHIPAGLKLLKVEGIVLQDCWHRLAVKSALAHDALTGRKDRILRVGEVHEHVSLFYQELSLASVGSFKQEVASALGPTHPMGFLDLGVFNVISGSL